MTLGNSLLHGWTRFANLRRTALAGACLLALAACDNAEERAAAHYAKGVELVAAGEVEKAIIEFRNALKLDQDAVAPRLEFARLLLEQGRLEQAAGHFQRLTELDPEHTEARISLARILLIGNQAGDARRHIDAALANAPKDVEARALKATYFFREEQPEEAMALAQEVTIDRPGHPIASMVIANVHMGAERYADALAALDPAIARTPDDLGLHLGKLRALRAAQDEPQIGRHLVLMVDTFPTNIEVARALAEWHVRRGENDQGEAVLRALALRLPDNPDHALAVVGLLNRLEGPDAARAELKRLVDGEAHRVIFARAYADFEAREGNLDGAATRLRALLETDLEDNEADEVKVELANTLRAQGDLPAAVALANEVLERDRLNVGALKISAVGHLEAEDETKAIADLRIALDNDPTDASILTMMAIAHERNGSRGLAQERLALAMQVSEGGAEEALRYADFLVRDERLDVAQTVLVESLSRQGDNTEVLIALARIQLSKEDWQQAEETALRLDILGRTGDERAKTVANEIRAAAFTGQQKFESSIGILGEMWDQAGEETTAMETLTATYIQTGRADEAAAFLDEILESEKTNIRALLLRGAVHAFVGEVEEAEAMYRRVIETHPRRENGYGALANLLTSIGRLEEADEVIRLGIENAQNTVGLLLSRAARLEREGAYEDAIKIYEQLYENDRLSDVLANNLASLLAEHRTDEESLARAGELAQRLRSAREPAFQDTYGWVLYRLGDYERALEPLTRAAVGLPDNPLVQYHLGMTYARLGQRTRALEALTIALDLSAGSTAPQFEDARAEMSRLLEEKEN